MSKLVTTTIQDLGSGNNTAVLNAIHGSAKAWVNFNGTGVVAIRASYNVTSITDNGTGDYTINLTNALADADYAVAGTMQEVSATLFGWCSTTVTVTTTTYRAAARNQGGTLFDPTRAYLAFFR